MRHTLMIAVTVLAMLTASMKGQDVGLAIFNHQIMIGMTYGNVVASWGRPYDINRSISQYEVEERWWYLDHGRLTLVVFENGIVSYIGQ